MLCKSIRSTHHGSSEFTFIILEDIFFVIFRIIIFFGKPNSIRSSLQTVASLKACKDIFSSNILNSKTQRYFILMTLAEFPEVIRS